MLTGGSRRLKSAVSCSLDHGGNRQRRSGFMPQDSFVKRKESLACDSELTAFNVAAVAGAMDLAGGGEPLYCVSDPFDGSWLFKRQLPLWWYTSLAFFAKDFTPLSTATGDGNQNLIAS